MSTESKHFEKKDIQTELKHLLLDRYLLNWGTVFINAANGSRIKKCHFVDGFAGRGSFNDGKNGSPMIAANNLFSLQKEFQKRYIRNELRFILHMIELNKEYCNELNTIKDKFLHTGLMNVYNGRFEDHISNLLTTTKGSPAFYFIDPFGYKGVNMSDMHRIIQQPYHEILINVMSYSLVRNYSIQSSKNGLCKFFGLNSLPNDLYEYLEEAQGIAKNPLHDNKNFLSLEEKLISLYKHQLSKCNIKGPLYTLSKRIHSQVNPNIYFHMVFATRNRAGLIEMKKAMVEYEQMRELQEERYLQENNSDSFSLYDNLFSEKYQLQSYSYFDFVKELRKNFNRNSSPITYGNIVDYFLQNTPLPFKDLKNKKSIYDFTKRLATSSFIKTSSQGFSNSKEADNISVKIDIPLNYLDSLKGLPEEPPQQLSLF